MHWAQAELIDRGYQVEPGPGWGADYVATREGRTFAVRTQLSGSPPIAKLLELEGARRYLDCQEALMLLTGSLGEEASQVAGKLGIILEPVQLSGERLWPWLAEQRGELPEEVLREVLDRIMQGQTLTREQLNDLAGTRASSSLIALLTQLPDIEFGGYPAGLRLLVSDAVARVTLKDLGYQGFRTVSELTKNSSEVPLEAGCYALEWAGGEPEFLSKGSGGFSKGDPNVPTSVLRRQWTSGASIVYVGRAGAPGTKATLRSRVKQLLEFGQGQPAKHYGGRYLWQLKQAPELLVAWKVGDPAALEQEVLEPFVAHFGRLPFANLQE